MVSFYCQPDGFAAGFGFDDFVFQAMEPDAGVEHPAYLLVLAHQDAALRVLGRVARVDADALPFLVELRIAKHQRKPFLELRRVGDDDSVSAFRNGTFALDFVGPVLVVAPSRFQRVAEERAIDGEPANRVVLAFRNACKDEFHAYLLFWKLSTVN